MRASVDYEGDSTSPLCGLPCNTSRHKLSLVKITRTSTHCLFRCINALGVSRETSMRRTRMLGATWRGAATIGTHLMDAAPSPCSAARAWRCRRASGGSGRWRWELRRRKWRRRCVRVVWLGLFVRAVASLLSVSNVEIDTAMVGCGQAGPMRLELVEHCQACTRCRRSLRW